MELDTIVCSDALIFLQSLPDASVNCLVTSPPYFGLRDYGIAGQIGLEDTPQVFVKTMVELFREALRVLRDDGTCWLNLGDSYVSGGNSTPQRDTSGGFTGKDLGTRGRQGYAKASGSGVEHNRADIGLAPKNLLGIPWRTAFALQDDGWILRSDIIWAKSNPMPESVTDRCTKSHEYVFMFAKSEKYWYDADAIREKAEYGRRDWKDEHYKNGDIRIHHKGTTTGGDPSAGRNKRTVWTVSTEATPFAHFATFPQKLIEPMILAGCPHKVCVVCGAPWVRQVEVSGGTIGKGGWHDHSDDLGKGMLSVRGNGINRSTADYKRETLGFMAQCQCNVATRPGITLDPFMGSGTTGLVARRLGRHYIGCDLSPVYVDLARKRLAVPYTLPMLAMLE